MIIAIIVDLHVFDSCLYTSFLEFTLAHLPFLLCKTFGDCGAIPKINLAKRTLKYHHTAMLILAPVSSNQ